MLWRRLLERATTVFDVGANIGMYSMLAAMRLQGRGSIHSFEPNPEVVAVLRHNARLNGFTNARIAQLALADSNSQARFFIPNNGAWTNGSLIEGFVDQAALLVVDTMRFDTYCQTFKVDRVDLIKIDVEGAEPKVLKGMGELLDKWRPDIICEVLEGYAEPLNKFFYDTPYRKFLISPDGLQETSVLRPHHEFRDYYLSCAPHLDVVLS